LFRQLLDDVGDDVNQLVCDIVGVAGVLTPIGIAILSIPSSLFSGKVTAQAIVFSIELVIVAAIAVPVLVRQWRRARADGSTAASPFVRIYGPVYLGVLAVLWISALPAYLAAADGMTSDGTPTGSLLHTALSFVVAALGVGAAASVGTHERRGVTAETAGRS
jgi:hypothetical protein